MYQSSNGGLPFQEFMAKQDKKMQRKLIKGFKCMILFKTFMTEPHVKHFALGRYAKLYEYRERIRIMARIIFAFDKHGNIILLYPFIKKNERDTMNALEQSVKMLSEIKSNTATLVEYKMGDK